MPSRGRARGVPEAVTGPCRHAAGRPEPPQWDIAAVLTVALSHCDGSGPPRARPAAGPERPGRSQPGISADADGPARDTPQTQVVLACLRMRRAVTSRLPRWRRWRHRVAGEAGGDGAPDEAA